MPERRHEPRAKIEGEVNVRVQLVPEAPDLEGQTFPSLLADVSLGGLQLDVGTDIPVGSLLMLEIVFAGSLEKYWHIGKVMWKVESTDESGEDKPHYRIGIAFKPFANTELETWDLAVKNLLEEAKMI